MAVLAVLCCGAPEARATEARATGESAAPSDAAALSGAAAESPAVAERHASLAYDGALSQSGSATQIVIKFDGKPDYRLFFMENPVRLVLETERSGFALPEDFAERKAGLIEQLRFGSVTRERSRLVASLAGPAEIIEKSLEADPATGRYTLSLKLAAIPAATFSERVRQQEALLGSSGGTVVKGGRVGAPPKREGYFTIVIDPGHGGIDGGSKGRKIGLVEKEVTLGVGKKLGPLLEKAGPFHIVYTREEDVFVSLRERQAVAERANGDLMISIHADSLRQKFVRGATVYTLADKATDALAQQVADSENLADVVAGLAAPEESDAVTDILADLTLRETTRFSHAFAAMLVRRLRDRVELINNPHRAASFAVLKNAEVPSVLLELGYLSNADDEKLMGEEKWQQQAAEVVVEAVREFFATRIGRSDVKGG
ncbi:MAG: N-acetylmuramoyl-L-alanine amidase [Nitratireductor sp.]|nr:N-acetylmuramoyl-L-alanine amidase [Nitratireductor sp.]